MTSFQTTVKYIAIVFAVCLAVGIIGGILGALGIACGFFGDDGVLDGMKTYEISENITDIRIEINAADLTVSTADGFSLESNLKYLSVKENDGCLVITEKKRFGINYDAPELKLCIPEGLVFGEATIITGAGRVSIDTLCADKLKMELGAGEVVVNSIDTDGVKGGFDIEMLSAVCSAVNVPVIASGGAGSTQDFIKLFEQIPDIDAALAASVFHFGEIRIPELKSEMQKNNITVRL